MYKYIPLLFVVSCMSVDDTQKEKLFKKHEKKERIMRHHGEKAYPDVVSEGEEPLVYPWE